MLAFLKLAWPYLLAATIGAGGAWFIKADIDGAALADEQSAHAYDNERHESALNAISKAALDAEQRAIDNHTVAEGRIATLDDQLTKEKEAHEADNSRNRAAIADGTRRLRIAVSNFHPAGGDQVGPGAPAAGVDDGSSGTAELPRPFGVALFGIVDSADDDARAKAVGLQRYVQQLEDSGYIAKAADK